MRLSGEASVPWAGLDDPVACALHLGGALFFGWQAAKLVRRAGKARRRAAALMVFAGSGILVLATSALYHAIPLDHEWKIALQRADHAAVFLLIAGTLTPYHAIGFHGRGRFLSLGFVWAFAVGALVTKTLLWSRVGDGLGFVLYLALAALGLAVVAVLPRRLPWSAFATMMAGALVYAAGASFDHFQVAAIVPGWFGHHEVFHIAVLAGLFIHWRFFHDWSAPGLVPAPAVRARLSATVTGRPCARDGVAD